MRLDATAIEGLGKIFNGTDNIVWIYKDGKGDVQVWGRHADEQPPTRHPQFRYHQLAGQLDLASGRVVQRPAQGVGEAVPDARHRQYRWEQLLWRALQAFVALAMAGVVFILTLCSFVGTGMGRNRR